MEEKNFKIDLLESKNSTIDPTTCTPIILNLEENYKEIGKSELEVNNLTNNTTNYVKNYHNKFIDDISKYLEINKKYRIIVKIDCLGDV